MPYHLEKVVGDLLVCVVLDVPPVLAVEDCTGGLVDLTVPLLLPESRVESRGLVPVVNCEAPPPPSVVLAPIAGDLGAARERPVGAILVGLLSSLLPR